MLRLHRGAIHDQARRRSRDLGHLHEPVGSQRLPGLDQVDDPFRQPHQRRQLDRAVEPYDLDLDTATREVLLGQARILRRDTHPGPPRRIVSLPQGARLGDDQATHAEPEVERLVHVRFLLEQDVLAHDAEIGGAIGDVRRHVDRLQEEQAQPAPIVVEDQLPRLGIDAVDTDRAEHVERAVEQTALRQRERQCRAHGVRSMSWPAPAGSTPPTLGTRERWPETNRKTPARSGCRRTSPYPASSNNAATASTWLAPAVSTMSGAPDFRIRLAWTTSRRRIASPSRPPRSAPVGSCARTSRGA